MASSYEQIAYWWRGVAAPGLGDIVTGCRWHRPRDRVSTPRFIAGMSDAGRKQSAASSTRAVGTDLDPSTVLLVGGSSWSPVFHFETASVGVVSHLQAPS
jgi:hypothetical protein